MNIPTPSEFKALLVTASGATCDKLLRSLFTFPAKFYDFYSTLFNEDGTLSQDFTDALCAIDCTSVGSGGGSSILAPSITWSAGTPPRLSWNTVAGAAYYELARNTENDLNTAELVTTTTLNFFDDAGAAASTYYWYWVRGLSGSAIGSWSAAQLGARAIYTVTTATGLATSGTPNYVELTWNAIPEATAYQVVRNTSNTTAGATALANATVPFYHDFVGTLGVSFYYFLRAYNPYNAGAFTTGVAGTRA